MGGGMAVMGADAIKSEGLELPALSSATMEKLNKMMSGRWSHGNPVDPGGDLISYHALWPLLEDENVDAIIIIGGVAMIASFPNWVKLPPSALEGATERKKAMESMEVKDLEKTIDLMKKHGKPILFTSQVFGAARRGMVNGMLMSHHLSFYSTPERAARTLRYLVEYSEYLGIARVR
jgi:acyl-CoA synthetase (NDP forming)